MGFNPDATRDVYLDFSDDADDFDGLTLRVVSDSSTPSATRDLIQNHLELPERLDDHNWSITGYREVANRNVRMNDQLVFLEANRPDEGYASDWPHVARLIEEAFAEEAEEAFHPERLNARIARDFYRDLSGNDGRLQGLLNEALEPYGVSVGSLTMKTADAGDLDAYPAHGSFTNLTLNGDIDVTDYDAIVESLEDRLEPRGIMVDDFLASTVDFTADYRLLTTAGNQYNAATGNDSEPEEESSHEFGR